MTQSNNIDPSSEAEQGRRPRVVILGEFSAGKSTLINLFTGGSNLRTQVTATQMPPVWISHGTDEPYRVDLSGAEHAVDLTDPDSIEVSETLYVRSFMQAPLLENFDLIDTPGNSDPNIASEAWERAAELADIAIWCSSSTQAWRQSELAAWRDVPEAVRQRSILLLTRADKLTTDEDRAKVLGRVKREAGDLFSHIHMASLLSVDNIQPMLADLVSLSNSLSGSDHSIAAPVASTPVEATTTEAASNTETEPAGQDSGDMTDDMLIDSLDLSDENTLDELILNDGDDADMDAVLAALETGAPVAAAATAATAATAVAATSAFAEDETPSQDDQSELTAPEVADEPVQEAFEQDVPEQPAPISAEGYASELWRSMSASIPFDDADAYEAAFDMFLEKVDTEIAMLRGQLNMQAVG